MIRSALWLRCFFKGAGQLKICIMPALFVVAALAELISGASGPIDVDVVEIIASIVTMGSFALMGYNLKIFILNGIIR